MKKKEASRNQAPRIKTKFMNILLPVQVTVGLPDIKGREEILKVHSNGKKLDKDVSLSVIAMRTPGFSGADLANL